MGWLAWIGVGLVAGIIAKIIMPGRDPGGLIVTIIIGIVGGLLGGFISVKLGYGDLTGFNLMSILIAVLGSILLLIIYRVIKR
jgi:uncharacterized membrane protein YeaQ/YmgE (transglycosylase-associated protein family)